MVAASTLMSALAILPLVPAVTIGPILVKPDDLLPTKKCDVVCDWEGDKPAIPECFWDQCLANIEGTTCTQAEIESTDDNADEERFNSVYSIFLYENLTIGYEDDKDKRLPFTAWISDQLHGPENMDCRTLTEHSGCNNFLQCDDVDIPGGYFVLNSFITIHNVFRNFYEGVQHARGDIQASVSTLGDTFSPISESSLSTAVIIDLVTMGYLAAAAPFWNAIIKKSPWFRRRGADEGWRSINANTHGTMKDLINGMVGSSLTLAKDLTKAEAENAVEREMSKLMNAMINAYSTTLDKTVSRIFNGKKENVDLLYRMLDDGKFINSIDLNLSTEEIKTLVKAPIYTQLIPRAWRLSNLPVGPFIYDTGFDCNADGSLKDPDDAKDPNVSKEMLEKNSYCHDGKLYILASAPDPEKYCTQRGDTSGSCFKDFQQLPGADELDGKKWGKIRPKDITHAAVNTWIANGKKNTGKGLDLDTEFANIEDYGNLESDDIVDRVLDAGIHTPGLVLLPVCDFWDAREGWEEGYNTLGGTANFKPWSTYPCSSEK